MELGSLFYHEAFRDQSQVIRRPPLPTESLHRPSLHLVFEVGQVILVSITEL